MHRLLSVAMFAIALVSVSAAHGARRSVAAVASPAPERADRAVLRRALTKLRVHPRGTELVVVLQTQELSGAKTIRDLGRAFARIELGGGRQALISVATDDYAGSADIKRGAHEVMTVHGRIGRGDDALFYLRGAERKEVQRWADSLRTNDRGEFRLVFERPIDLSEVGPEIDALANTSRHARNYLVLKALGLNIR